MVVSRVATDKEAKPLGEEFGELNLGPPGEDDYTASVYGSRFAAQDLPKHEMPEFEMPREVVYRMIKWVHEGTGHLKHR